MESLPLLLAALGTLLLALFLANLRLASPALAIPIRWLRWILFSLFIAELNARLDWIDRPPWVVAASAFLLWFLGEVTFNWLRVSAISLSPLPLFPKFVANTAGDEWPVQRRLLRMRDWLRAQGYAQVQALRAEVGGGIWLRVSVYQSADATVRVQVAFLPQENGAITVCFSAASETASGRRYVTDNFFLPFGGFYPENWQVERCPWWRSLRGLIARHHRRLKQDGETAAPWQHEPLADLNRQQQIMERVNTELGFLLPHFEREEFGKITPEGRYRVWKEAWLLNYLGLTSRYH